MLGAFVYCNLDFDEDADDGMGMEGLILTEPTQEQEQEQVKAIQMAAL